jgi:hypothetical protein
MDSAPEFDVEPRRDKHGVFIGGYIWTVYDAATQGPIDGGFEFDQNKAILRGRLRRDEIARTMYGQSANEFYFSSGNKVMI